MGLPNSCFGAICHGLLQKLDRLTYAVVC